MPRLHPNGERLYYTTASTGEGPHLLSNVEDNKVLATGYGVFPEPHNEPVTRRPPFVEKLNARITLIDTLTGEPAMSASLNGCARPHASWLVEQRAFIVCEDEAKVIEIDTGKTRVVDLGSGSEGALVVDGLRWATGKRSPDDIRDAPETPSLRFDRMLPKSQ